MGEGTTVILRPWLSLTVHHELSYLYVSVPWHQALCWWGRLATTGRKMDTVPALTRAGWSSAKKNIVAEWTKSRAASSVTALSLPSRKAGQLGIEREVCSEAMQSWALPVGLRTQFSSSLSSCPCLRKDLLGPPWGPSEGWMSMIMLLSIILGTRQGGQC